MPPSDLPERANSDPSGSSAVPPARTPSESTQPHRDSAGTERESADWDGIAAMPEFRTLLAKKARFIIAGTIFFLAYYFALPILVGWFPELMERKVGPVNLAYVFALSQFIMAWVVAGVYVKVAAGWDRSAEAIIQKAERK